MTIVEALSRNATEPPDWMAKRNRTPVGKFLFHGTPLDHLINIIKTNTIDTGIDWRGEGERVSLSRSYKVALGFGEQGDFSDYPSVLVLDWKRLALAYHVIPHMDVDADGKPWQNQNSEDGTEQEEAVYGDIKPLSRFLISINIDPALLMRAVNADDFIGWCIEEKGWCKTKRGVINMLNAIAKSPLLNRWQP